ncbi:hypothetical protein LMG9964_06729 [Paraburkholderia phenoliruptrix]|uniref:Uncharacterized protein n=1 Tax=Paraburkholderia phenoliruptrix TaxID=252970 RepID=A0A6J5KGV5_9BURK|nr:hypothetical protein LMG9964_06729 [Paraburkholderia phenoliruptrix]
MRHEIRDVGGYGCAVRSREETLDHSIEILRWQRLSDVSTWCTVTKVQTGSPNESLLPAARKLERRENGFEYLLIANDRDKFTARYRKLEEGICIGD